MQKRAIATALAAALPLLASGSVLAQESPFSANVGIVSDYQYRGISQTSEKPALQGGFDFAHDSGFYVGVWGSNVSWLQDLAPGSNNSLELDIYAGYATEVGPIGIDVGLLQYYYPGKYNAAWKAEAELDNPNTLEGYVGLSWEFVSFKYSHSFTDLFGAIDSKNSQYFDLSASYELMDGLTLDAHYGYQKIKNGSDYADWKLGVTKSLGGFDIGLHYVDTDIKGVKEAEDRVILSVSKSF